MSLRKVLALFVFWVVARYLSSLVMEIPSFLIQ